MTPLDFTPFASALARLEEGVAAYRRDNGDAIVRDGLIQRRAVSAAFGAIVDTTGLPLP